MLCDEPGQRLQAMVPRRELDTLAHIASHDLQEPLRKILLCSDGLLALDQDLGVEARELLQIINSSVGQMRHVVDAVRRYASIAVSPELIVPADLHQIALDAVSVVEDAGGESRVDSLPLVDADPDLLSVVFRELCANAVQYAEPSRPLTVRVQGQARGERVEVSVSDNGMGLPHGFGRKAFEPFQTAHASRSGIGVGLTICRRVVEEHGGNISMRQSPDVGTTVTFSLPLVAGDLFW